MSEKRQLLYFQMSDKLSTIWKKEQHKKVKNGLIM